ncbi:mitochondrial 2-enoyl thioester reductase [Diatrype stigma]|uniref:Mitochondrial 2-enoyl thioester reductase n=1 Tax=Diatrype stigma TaxID=117547 RepID=A0AAN9USK5_9PEZI
MITARPLGSTRQATTTALLLKRSYRTAVSANARPTLRCGATAAKAKAVVTPPLTSVRYKSGPYGYTQAKALVFSKFGEPSDVLKIHTHSISPTLPADSVLLRTLAAPINPADVNTIQGTYGVKPTFSPLIGTAEPSAIPGNEGVFEVQASTSPALAKGDWVIPARTGFGTWRTHAVAAAADLIPIRKDGPEGALNRLQAATVAVNPCSAYRMLRDFVGADSGSGGGGPMREGDWFLQNGANSGVGRAAIQLGRRWGLRSINVVRARPTAEATEALRAELTALGATHVVTEEEFLTREFGPRLASWTRDAGPQGVRLGLNCVGGKSAQTVARNLGPAATMVTYGGMARQPVALPTGQLIFRDLRLRGFWLSRWADADVAAKRATVEEILEMCRRGEFADVPVNEVRWDWEAEEGVLRGAVQGTLEGFRGGKGVFVFEET